MGFFSFLWNCIFSYIELLNNVPIVNGYSALDFILCCLLFGFLIHILLKRSRD